MKKLIVMMLFLASIPLLAQKTQVSYTTQGKIVAYDIPISLSTSATNYSDAFSLDGYLPGDSTHYFPVLWQCDDTVQVSIYLQVRNTLAPLGTSYLGSWQTVGTLATLEANAGNDTLYVQNIVQRGAVASGVADLTTLAGKVGNEMRFKITFANKTTVGNSGHFRIWAILPKR